MDAREEAYFRTRLPDTKERRRLWPILVEYLQRRFIPEDAVVLDLGAGYCYFANAVRAREKHAVDTAGIVARYAAADVVAHVGPSSDLHDLPDDHFDVVFASNLLEHLERDEVERTLAEVRRVLCAGGRFIVVQPNYRLCYKTYFDDYTHKQVFTERSLTDLLRVSGLEPTTVIPRFLPFSAESRLPASASLLRIYLRLPYRPLAAQMLVVAEKGGVAHVAG